MIKTVEFSLRVARTLSLALSGLVLLRGTTYAAGLRDSADTHVIVAILRATVRRAIVGFIPFLSKVV